MSTEQFRVKIWGALVAILLILLGSVTTPVSYSQTSAWSEPVPLSPAERSAWFPDIAVGPQGQIHVAWSAGAEIKGEDKNSAIVNSYTAVIYTTSLDGQEWSKPIDIAALPGPYAEVSRPTLLVDQRGMLHMTYRREPIFYSHSPEETAASSSSWSLPRQITVNEVGYFSQPALDKQGMLHVVFTENVILPDCPICFHLFYRRSSDNGLTWSGLTDISKLPTGAAKPQILVDKQNNLHVVWEAGPGGTLGSVMSPTKIMYAASYDGGKTWTTPVEFLTPNGTANNVAIGLDREGKLLVAWLSPPEDLVYYQLSQDQGHSWSLPRPIPGIWGGASVYATRQDDYAMATDGSGDVHLVLVGRTSSTQKSLSVLHLIWNGVDWSPPEAITTLIGDAPEWPRLAAGYGNQLHVVWFVRDAAHVWDSTNQKYRIWYARGTSSAPPASPVIRPTFTPKSTPKAIATPVPTPSATLSPTPTPTLDPSLAQAPVPAEAIDSVYTDMDEIKLLIGSLVPAGLVIVVVMIGVRLRRR